MSGGGVSSSDVGLEEKTLLDHPVMSVCQACCCLARLGLGELDVVVSEAGDPLVQQVVGAAHLLGLLSNQVLLDFSVLVVG